MIGRGLPMPNAQADIKGVIEGARGGFARTMRGG
jgi:hypothetical protein